MSENMILLLKIIICILLFNYLCKFITWALDLCKTTPKITFKAFKKVYCLYPSKWSLENTYVRYYPQSENSNIKSIGIDFKYFHDYLLYCRFKKKIEKDHDYEKQLKNEKILIECLQKDINTYREENLNEINKIINK